MVVGSTGDPATPYAWAQSVAVSLQSGVLLTYHGEGHIAFGRESKSSCIGNARDAYFLTLALPAAGTTCQPDGPIAVYGAPPA